MVDIIGRSKIWFIFSGTLVVLSLIFVLLWGLKPGIDFTGGSLVRIKISEVNLSNEGIIKYLESKPVNEEEGDTRKAEDVYGQITIQRVSAGELILRLKNLTENDHQILLKKLEQLAQEKKGTNGEGGAKLIEEVKFDSIGPSIGKELVQKSRTAVIIAVVAIVLFVAWAFRMVSSRTSKYESLRYGVVVIVALVHDIVITLGFFAILGKVYNVEVDTFFIAALLTVLGYSVNDTIIIFDRIRENVLKEGRSDFEAVVNKSLNQTIMRSLFTSGATLAVLLSLLFFGGQSTFYFVLALVVGIGFGTYSSIFLASPLLVYWKRWDDRRRV